MSDHVQVSISFREEVVGDTAGTDSFYVKMTPRVKTKPIITAATLEREFVKQLQAEIRARRKK